MSDKGRLFNAAKALLAKVRKDHPGEDLYVPEMIELDEAVKEIESEGEDKE
jgi:hypothetical protein